jgi:hypothetical protein
MGVKVLSIIPLCAQASEPACSIRTSDYGHPFYDRYVRQSLSCNWLAVAEEDKQDQRNSKLTAVTVVGE